MNFGIGFAFSKGPGSAFSEGPGPGTGPLYKLCHMEQKIEVEKPLKEFNAESAQEISEHLQQNLSSFVSLLKAFEESFNQKTLNSFVEKQPFFVATSEIKRNTEEVSKDHTFSVCFNTQVN